MADDSITIHPPVKTGQILASLGDPRLTPEQALFCALVAGGCTGTRAYLTVRPNVKPDSARATAVLWRRKLGGHIRRLQASDDLRVSLLTDRLLEQVAASSQEMTGDRLKAADMLIKLLGRYAPDTHITVVQDSERMRVSAEPAPLHVVVPPRRITAPTPAEMAERE